MLTNLPDRLPSSNRYFCYLFVSLMTLSQAVHAAKPAAQPQHVIVAPVQAKELSDRIEALGTARANESVNITANVTEKVKSIQFEDGQQVSAGYVLVLLEAAEEQANLVRTKSILNQRLLALERLRRLAKRNLTPTDELDRARLDVEQARATITATEAMINDRVIRAPFDGIVGLRQISVGALVESGSQITTLDDIGFIKLDFTVPAVFLAELKKGLKIKARAEALGEKIYNGEVKSIDTRVDPITRSVIVRAVLPNPEGKIVPGVLMQVDLLRNTRQTLVIPEAALLPLGNKQFVMVRVSKDGKDSVVKREVKIGGREPGFVEIVEGLSVDEQVVTHGNSKVGQGSPIKVLAVDDGSVDIATIIKGKKIKSTKP